MFDFKIMIAGKVIRFKCDDPALIYDASREREFKSFLYTGTDNEELILDIKNGFIPDFFGKKLLFNIEGNWSLSSAGGQMLFEYPDRSLRGRMKMAGVVNKEMTEGTIYINKSKTAEEENEAKRQRALSMIDEKRGIRDKRMAARAGRVNTGKVATPARKVKMPREMAAQIMADLKANFFQAFLVEYIIKKESGFLVHCSSICRDNRLYLFMGKSGAGKSTIADFWHEAAGAAVFNDDKAIIAVKEGEPYFYNAPWAGTLSGKCALGQGDRTKIDGIFFIYQDGVNSLKKVGRTEAAAKIFRNSFPVFWEKEAISYVLGACSEIAGKVPCYDLGFVNNDSVVGFLEEKIKIMKERAD